MAIKAIETAYQGYRFRSRLEARWAVFFNALGLRWQYEPEGFELPGGERYLPDFLLLDNGRMPDIFIEVKPPTPLDRDDGERWRKFAVEMAASRGDVGCLMVRGDPLNSDGYLFGSFSGELRAAPLVGENFVGFWAVATGLSGDALADAALAARRARFEHGESGAC